MLKPFKYYTFVDSGEKSPHGDSSLRVKNPIGSAASQKRIYLDHNATTPLSALVAQRIPEWLAAWGNPSSIHWSGREPKQLMRISRQALASSLNCDPLELILTSGGSESNNLALKGKFFDNQNKNNPRNEYLISAVEHPSVVQAAQFLKKLGAKVFEIPVNRDGQIDLEYLEQNLSEKTALVSIMYANNETGSLFPIKKICEMAHSYGALVHCDAVQALGKVEVDLGEWGVDMASFSGHKFYSLKGAGLLFVRRGTSLEPLIGGGAQERRRRAGTENVLAFASLAEMTRYLPELSERMENVKKLRDSLQSQILNEIPDVHVTGGKVARIANSLSLTIDGVDGESLLMNLDMSGFAVSTGAACSSGNPEPSPVLLAMGLSRQEAQSSLRVGLGWGTEKEDVDEFLTELTSVVARLRSFR